MVLLEAYDVCEVELAMLGHGLGGAEGVSARLRYIPYLSWCLLKHMTFVRWSWLCWDTDWVALRVLAPD